MKRNAHSTIEFSLFVLILLFGLTACNSSKNQGASASDADNEHLAQIADGTIHETFGNGFKDLSPVVARVGDLEITEQDMELRLREMSKSLKTRFAGETGNKSLIRFMVDEALLCEQAKENKLYLNANVAQQLISFHRQTLIEAYKQLDVFKHLAPTSEEIKQYYQENRDKYVIAGALHARHIECLTEADARAAYDALRGTGKSASFASVLVKYTKNLETAKKAGDLGWFNKGGFVAHVKAGPLLSETVWDWKVGLHEPVKIGERWQVIEILGRRNPRQQALAEVRDKIIQEMTPSLQAGALDARLEELRKTASIEYMGSLAPGAGRSPEELIKSGLAAKDFDQKLDLYDLVIDDYPETEYAAQALFLKANSYIDQYGDTRRAGRYLRQLVADYPDSPLQDQAKYMLDNLNSRNFRTPTSIEELRKVQQ